MPHLMQPIILTLSIMLLVANPAYAGDTVSEINQRIGTGDPVAGKDKSAFCQGCHGEDGNSVSGVFPKLSGQWFDYLQKQIREFQNGARFNETMTDMAAAVTDFDDLFDIAAYFASQKQMQVIPIEDERERKLYLEGEQLYTKGNKRTGAFRCIKCHGIRGKGEPLNNNLFPVLGGQHKEYLMKQLHEFKSEDRENDRSGMMLRITTHLTDHDIEAVATYLSRKLEADAPVELPPVVIPAPEVIPEEISFNLQGAFFAVNSAELKEAATKRLAPVLEFANNQPAINLEIIGHTDSSGSSALNRSLSLARAESVKRFLIENGVAESRLFTKGMGETMPIADNKTPAGKVRNRRVEIHSMPKKPPTEE